MSYAVVRTMSWTRRFYVAITLILIAMVVAGVLAVVFRAAAQRRSDVGPGLSMSMGRSSWVDGAACWPRYPCGHRSGADASPCRERRDCLRRSVFVLGLVVSFAPRAACARRRMDDEHRCRIPDPAAGRHGVVRGRSSGRSGDRRQPEIHKRLILAATVALAFAAVGRMEFRQRSFPLVWLSPLFAAMAFDAFSRRRVHPVHFISVTVFAVAFARIFLMESEGWLTVGRALLSPILVMPGAQLR